MILTENAAWPPEELAHLLKPVQTWAAWYEGDPDKLADLYSGTSAVIRPSQLSGGVVGRVARWFWGQPQQNGQQRSKSHIPIARDIAKGSSVLLFGEELQLDLTIGKDAAGKPVEADGTRLMEILDGNRWQSLLPEAAEFCAALGGVYLRCGWDDSVAAYPLISIVQPDGAVPTFRWGRLSEVTFWQEARRQGADVWRHFETHRPGHIEHQLFMGGPNSLGTVVPLDESDQTRGLQVNAESRIETGTERLTACYVPNMRPAPMWRNDPVGRNLGVSDFAGIEPLMDELDEAWSNLRREDRLNKTRIMAASALLESNGPGAGAMFDVDREVFVGLQAPADVPGLAITTSPTTLTVADRLSRIDTLARNIYSDAGYSPATFGMEGDVGVTATEVAARERRTMNTREVKTRYWTPALEDFLHAVTEVDKHVFGKGTPIRPRIAFPASVSPTIAEVGQTAQMLRNAQAASIETLVKMVHPDWDDTQVAEEVARIVAENAMTAPTITLPDPQVDPNAVQADTDSDQGQ